jgi:hypothetical protein
VFVRVVLWLFETDPLPTGSFVATAPPKIHSRSEE